MKTETITYQDQGVTLQGYLAYENRNENKRPAVLVTHDWSGRNEFACKKAEQLAQMGYAGFALDMFGEARVANTNEEKSKLIQPFIADRYSLMKRIKAALYTVQKLPMVDKQKIAVIGFCFGGLCALDLARSGADIRGVVSFHGLLFPPNPAPLQRISAKILALHGYEDPMVPPEQVTAFEKEMTAAKADWQLHIYANTAHAFTNPQAHDTQLGTIYNETPAKRSWIAMQNFLAEIFI